MPNGTPPESLFRDGALNALLFMPSIVKLDGEFGKHLAWDGESINLLWCVPITMAECQFKRDHGLDAVYYLFDPVSHPFIFRGLRSSYV
jgi:hypothetical protein